MAELVKIEFWVPAGLEDQVTCYVEEGIRRHIGQVQAEAVDAAIAAAAEPVMEQVSEANAALRDDTKQAQEEVQ